MNQSTMNSIPSSPELLEDDRVKAILVSDSSFDILAQRLKQSVKACDEFASYVTRKCHYEQKYSKEVSRTVTHCDHSIISNNIIVQGSFIQSLQKVIQFDEKVNSVKDPYITALQTISNQLESLSHHFTLLRKQLKEKGNKVEKEVLDSINLAKKARNRYWNLCSELEKVRNSDKNQTKITLQGRKTNSQQEEDLKSKIKDAEDDYNKKSNNSQRLKNTLINTHRPNIANEFKNLIIELDYAMQIQLQKYSIYTESLIVGMGNQINPINGSDSMKKIATNVDIEKCLYYYLKGSTIRVNENLEPIEFTRHPIVGGILPKPKTFTSIPTVNNKPTVTPLNPTVPSFNSSIQQQQKSQNQLNQSQNKLHSPIQSPLQSPLQQKSNQLKSSINSNPDSIIPSIPNNLETKAVEPPSYSSLDPGRNSPLLNGPRPLDSEIINNSSTSSFNDNSINFYGNTDNNNSFVDSSSIPNNEISHSKLFGVPLETLDANEEAVPLFVTKCIQMIEKYGSNSEGIYRLSPNKTNLEDLQNLIDKNPKNLSLLEPIDPTNVHSEYVYLIANIFKRFFSLLPDPLLTHEQRDLYLQAAQINDKVERQTKMHQLVFELPDSNYFTLRDLLGHFRRLIQMPRVRMDTKNIAILWANNLLGGDFNSKEELETQQKVIENLINFAPYIFTYEDGNSDNNDDNNNNR